MIGRFANQEMKGNAKRTSGYSLNLLAAQNNNLGAASQTLLPKVIIFHVFFNVCLHSYSFPLRADRLKSNRIFDGEPQGNWWRNSNSRNVVASSPSFSRPASRAPERACSQALFFLNI